MIFVTTSTIAMGNIKFQPQKEPIKLSEENILRAKSWQMRMLTEPVAECASLSSEMNVKISRKVTSSASFENKRKLDGITKSAEEEFSYEAKKRAHKVLGSSLDLNLPVEETEDNTNSGSCDSDSISENSTWLENFIEQVDEKVLFKSFDFDALCEKIGRKISVQVQRAFGSEILLEIDDEVMMQITAASWLCTRSRAMEDWIESVLGRGCSEALQKYHSNAQYVVGSLEEAVKYGRIELAKFFELPGFDDQVQAGVLMPNGIFYSVKIGWRVMLTALLRWHMNNHESPVGHLPCDCG
ncbi:hypothetical protein GH714_016990 [Hevea brasiliensis]|uniref:SMAX1-like AAA+ ATPase lid domain-containing protein n=1 Tax=Hevea brasiliensis TaxID=3981 RepID=A0A6A6KPS1_HEVBR|nr:hypothetical protein GH714_016990 [Hevea brasiliensis]